MFLVNRVRFLMTNAEVFSVMCFNVDGFGDGTNTDTKCKISSGTFVDTRVYGKAQSCTIM